MGSSFIHLIRIFLFHYLSVFFEGNDYDKLELFVIFIDM